MCFCFYREDSCKPGLIDGVSQGGNKIEVAHGSAHGKGIYTAHVNNPQFLGSKKTCFPQKKPGDWMGFAFFYAVLLAVLGVFLLVLLL